MTNLKRTVVKFSRDLPEEEMRKEIADLMNVPVEHLPPLHLLGRISELNKERDQLEKLTSSYIHHVHKRKPITQGKLNELNDVGRFLLAYDPNLNFALPDAIPDYPDFIVNSNDEKIGIEHTLLLSPGQQKAFKTAKHIVEITEHVIREKINAVSKTINIFLNFHERIYGSKTIATHSFTKIEIFSIAEIIAEYTVATIKENQGIRPGFISDIKITDNIDNRIDIVLAETYFAMSDIGDGLLTRISEKEKKSGKYRQTAQFDQLWLLIVIDDINSPSGYLLDAASLPKIANSDFDAIFLFEKYNGKWIKIYHSD